MRSIKKCFVTSSMRSIKRCIKRCFAYCWEFCSTNADLFVCLDRISQRQPSDCFAYLLGSFDFIFSSQSVKSPKCTIHEHHTWYNNNSGLIPLAFAFYWRWMPSVSLFPKENIPHIYFDGESLSQSNKIKSS